MRDDETFEAVVDLTADAGSMTTDEVRGALREAGVDLRSILRSVGDVLAGHDAERRRDWMVSAASELKRATSRPRPSAANMDRAELMAFLARERSAGGATAGALGQFWQKHSGSEPTDEDLRSLVEAILLERSLGGEDDGDPSGS